MNGKLFSVVAVLAAFAIVATQATVVYTTYATSDCTGDAISFYASTDPCGISKRSVQGGCAPYAPGGPYFYYTECSASVGTPMTPVPEGFVSVKYTTDVACDFTSYYLVATKTTEKTAIIIQTNLGLAYSNVTLSCDNNGMMGLEQCTEGFCVMFNALPYDTCTNITAQGFDATYSATQTSCVPVPQAPMDAPVAAPMASPMAASPMVATPTKTPTASTPVKKSDAASLVVGSVIALVVANLM